MPPRAADFDWLAFDAYGTLFDVTGEDWAAREVVQSFRMKQLQYTWLLSLMGDYRDFDEVSRAAIEWAAAAHGAEVDVDTVLARQLRTRTFPDVPDALARLAAAGPRLAIASNGRPESLQALVVNAGLERLVSSIVSVHPLGVFKPSPRVYALVLEQLESTRERLLFVSSNGWDIAGAAHFGLRAAWVNRTKLPRERVGGQPEFQVGDLSELAELFGA